MYKMSTIQVKLGKEDILILADSNIEYIARGGSWNFG